MQVNTTVGSQVPVEYQSVNNQTEVKESEVTPQQVQDYSDKVTISAEAAELLNSETSSNADTGTGIEPPQSDAETDTGTGIEPPQNEADTGTGIEPPAVTAFTGTGIEPPNQGN